jgi:SAM-dependent methyltransferase
MNEAPGLGQADPNADAGGARILDAVAPRLLVGSFRALRSAVMAKERLEQLQKQWNIAEESKALRAVLTRHGDLDVSAFLRSGVVEVRELLRVLDEHGLDWRQWRSVLDFGCGPGRLSQAFGAHFVDVTGVDVAPSMVELARSYAAASGSPCRFDVNARPDLTLFPDCSFDLVYSNLVLQHMPPELSRGYLAEFVRVLKPGGVAVFQLPSRPARSLTGIMLALAPIRVLRLFRKSDMYAIPIDEVTAVITAAGGEILDVRDDQSAGPNWISHTYIARHPAIPSAVDARD